MSIESPGAHLRIGRRRLVRYVAGTTLGVVVLAVLFSQRGDLAASWHQLAQLSWAWAVGAVAAEFASILAFSYIQHRVLATTGTAIGVVALVAVSLANNAIAYTVPGEPAVSSAFRYRQYRQRGASPAVSGWTILTIIIAQAVGLSLLILVGVLVSLFTGPHGDLTGVALIGLVVVLGAGALLARRELLLRFLGAVVHITQHVTKHPKGNIGERVTSTLLKMREFNLSTATTTKIVAFATLTWSLDFICLLCAFTAVHAPIPRDGVLLAFGAAQIVAVLPIVPGGLGLVEGSLAVILVAYGAKRVPALSTVLVYRFVSYWLAIGVGWFTFGLIMFAARRQKVTPAKDAETPSLREGDNAP